MRNNITTQIQRCKGVRSRTSKIALSEPVILPNAPTKTLLDVSGSISEQPVAMAVLGQIAANAQYSTVNHGDGTFTHTLIFDSTGKPTA